MRELSLGRSHTAVKAAVSTWQAVASLKPQLPVNVRDVEIILRASPVQSTERQPSLGPGQRGNGALNVLKGLLLPLAVKAVLLVMVPVALRVKDIQVLLQVS